MCVSNFGAKGFLMALLACGLGAHAAEVTVPVRSSSSLQLLEQKAGESDQYRQQYLALRKTLDDMLSLMPAKEAGTNDVHGQFGLLAELLDKAAESDARKQQVDALSHELDVARRQCDSLREELVSARAERDKSLENLKDLEERAEKWESVIVGLRETIKRLLLGEFEYYEVKEGDTLQSIAANPMVYGDAARAAWLRQVNEGQVKHLDHLRPGEVLVVPRFPRKGSYEF